MSSVLRAFFTAIAFCTIIPIPGFLQEKNRSLFMLYLPIAGLSIGTLVSLVAYASLLFAGPFVGAFLSLLFYCVLTGCLHLDGLADCADGFYGKKPRERVLEIMKDSRIGVMGGVAIGMALLGRFAVFSTLKVDSLINALPFCCMLSRSLPLVFPLVADYARQEGILACTPLPARLALFIAAFICAGTVCAFFPLPGAIALASGIGFIFYCRHKISGYTGDCMGAVIEISEIVFLIMFLIVERHG
ncbi:MAG: hypothetical protein A2268_10240 [Candidatus Raymondbacteria bacterium RifOxyA12_full_50_37]|uniref:Adenosylcobinamide-GDP ribazoletransferase n=1 Tax=Candidatus Raymondbacteria bacterium RIFOXYD12_FULL_49_13 TaxID=1817890 RepID=A0A1F7FL31_UNCRA|nr:MAG: hypothetical protein A2268_10240 [Candidatus Raymondbacteria bacterium RifOxyA12_full_50_37]OGJ90144.1 MAG: hypothetical protein A2248_16720 [Candidatus Raymondbacteria bacterium RIFOXYA2_FULL_49_16]OGJ97215.1 MAG: hypothetical protein A2453_01210 [Candidatus Raymondbacteria bacterium RIFOXYC2_FULL_50_21]OGK04483.1 MAG: hypothetical protein A2350_15250 [Candidatus Raymondbacteria bacterium RifOxyB12_full_50_8]OGK04709.1 MAG: hypothetical protein A2487_15520 [Candidatus Raymondbacteria b